MDDEGSRPHLLKPTIFIEKFEAYPLLMTSRILPAMHFRMP